MNYSEFLTKPRFSKSDLFGWSKADLTALSTSSGILVLPQKVKRFREDKMIDGVLFPSERTVILAAIEALLSQSVITFADPISEIQKTKEVWFSKAGMVVQKDDEKEIVSPPSSWPVDPSISKRPGLEQALHVCMALVKTEATTTGAVFVPCVNHAAWMTLSLSPVSTAYLNEAASLIVSILSHNVTLTKAIGSGRSQLNEIYNALLSMPAVEYLFLHYILLSKFLHANFQWSKQKGKQMPSILSYRNSSEKYVTAYNKGTSAVAFMTMYGTTDAYIWTGPIPSVSLKLPAKSTFYSQYKFLADCRSVRGTDEKGLSLMSSGFAATGNPTKASLRVQRFLSLSLGMSFERKNGNVYLHVGDCSSVPVILHHIDWWSSAIGKKFGALRIVVSSKVVAHYVDRPEVVIRAPINDVDVHLFFPDTEVPVYKEKEFVKTERASVDNIKSILHEYPNSIIYTAVMSPDIWDSWNVHLYGSPHAFRAIVSPQTIVPLLFCCNGDSKRSYHIESPPAIPVTPFLHSVMVANAKRTCVVFSPSYYFSPAFNLLRRAVGKTIDFSSMLFESGPEVVVPPSTVLVSDSEDSDDDSDDSAETVRESTLAPISTPTTTGGGHRKVVVDDDRTTGSSNRSDRERSSGPREKDKFKGVHVEEDSPSTESVVGYLDMV